MVVVICISAPSVQKMEAKTKSSFFLFSYVLFEANFKLLRGKAGVIDLLANHYFLALTHLNSFGLNRFFLCLFCLRCRCGALPYMYETIYPAK